MEWPKIDEKERKKEIKWMANYYEFMNKYQGSTTLNTKNGLAPFTIVDMWDKGARNEFFQHIKRDPPPSNTRQYHCRQTTNSSIPS